MKLSREIEKACGAPRHSVRDAVLRLLNLKYSNVEILKMAQASQLYALKNKGSFSVAFNLYVSALTVKPRPQAPAPTGEDVAPPAHPGQPNDPAPDQTASADGEPSVALPAAPSPPDQCPPKSKTSESSL